MSAYEAVALGLGVDSQGVDILCLVNRSLSALESTLASFMAALALSQEPRVRKEGNKGERGERKKKKRDITFRCIKLHK